MNNRPSDSTPYSLLLKKPKNVEKKIKTQKWTNSSPIIPFNRYKINNREPVLVHVALCPNAMVTQKIKQDQAIHIGCNIRRIRKEHKMKQVELVKQLQLVGVEMTRETLVKIERGIQHVQASQLQGIRDVLETTYDELLKPTEKE